jgi:hypothetical protein
LPKKALKEHRRLSTWVEVKTFGKKPEPVKLLKRSDVP